MSDARALSVRRLRGQGARTGCLLRNLLVERVTFPKRLERGYELGADGEFYFRFKGELTSGNAYLAPYDLRCEHVFVGSGEDALVSAIVITRRDWSGVLGDYGREEHRFWILFSHGNNADIGQLFPFYSRICSFLGVSLVAYDYSGFGLSPGRPSEQAMYENIACVYSHMRQELRVPHDRIIVYGNSLGSAPSCFLVSQPERFPVGGLVLHSALASALRVFFRSVARHHRFDAFDNAHFLLNCPLIPVFLLHGISDEQVPIEQAVELACVVKEAHEAQLSRMLDLNAKRRAEQAKEPGGGENEHEGCEDDNTRGGRPAHARLNRENIEIIPCGRFTSVIRDAQRKNRTRQFVKTWWVEGAGHEDLEAANSADYYDHMVKFLALCSKWRAERAA